MAESCGVVYFNHGNSHLLRLLVSIWSLRKFYFGPICIFDTDRGNSELLERIASSPRLHATVRKIDLVKVPRNSCYVTKSTLPRHSNFESTLLLDSDTLIVGDPTEILGLVARGSGLVVTRFSNWTVGMPIIKRRIAPWNAGLKLDPSFPAINTGVVAWRKGHPAVAEWGHLCVEKFNCPLTDELAMQLLVAEHPHDMLGPEYNLSPLYPAGSEAAAKIWHYHGGRHAKYERWQQEFKEVLRHDIAGCCNWAANSDDSVAEI